MLWGPTRRGAEGVSVEAELEEVSGLRLRPSELGIDRFVHARAPRRTIDPHQEVGNPTHPVVDEGHLIDDVEPVVPWGACPSHPVIEALARLPSRNLVDALPRGPVVGEALGLVLGPFLGEESCEAPKMRKLDVQQARIEALSQRQIVSTVEPCRDLRRCQKAVSHRSASQQMIRNHNLPGVALCHPLSPFERVQR
jgi:hypothetical protein